MTPSHPRRNRHRSSATRSSGTARLSRYRELRDFYDGVQWLGKPRRGEKRLVVNYARALVRKVVSYALPDPVGFEVPAPVLRGRESADRAVGRRTRPDVQADDPSEAAGSGAGAAGGRRGAGQQRGDAAGGAARRARCRPARFRAGHRLGGARRRGDEGHLGPGGACGRGWPSSIRRRCWPGGARTRPTEAYKFAQHYTLPGQAIAGLGWAEPGVLRSRTGSTRSSRSGRAIAGWSPSPGRRRATRRTPTAGCPIWCSRTTPAAPSSGARATWRICSISAGSSTAGSACWPTSSTSPGRRSRSWRTSTARDGIAVGPGAKWELPEG